MTRLFALRTLIMVISSKIFGSSFFAGNRDTSKYNRGSGWVYGIPPMPAALIKFKLGHVCMCANYSAVRRNFLARGSGESPATTAIRPGQLGPDSCATAGVATGAGRTQNHSADSCTTASILRAVEGVAPVEQLGSTSPQLPRIAMSADKVDLPSLSLVFETALSILFARAAVVNLLTHAAGRSGPCCPYVIAQVGVKSTGKTCPSERLDPRTTKGHGKHDPVVEGSCRPSFDHVPWGDNWHGAEVATDVTRNLLEELTIPEHQRRIVDLTKAFSIW